MIELWLNYWKTDWIPNCCVSCVSWDLTEDLLIQCDKWDLMKPNEFCDDFCIDLGQTPTKVMDIIEEYINKNSWN